MNPSGSEVVLEVVVEQSLVDFTYKVKLVGKLVKALLSHKVLFSRNCDCHVELLSSKSFAENDDVENHKRSHCVRWRVLKKFHDGRHDEMSGKREASKVHLEFLEEAARNLTQGILCNQLI